MTIQNDSIKWIPQATVTKYRDQDSFDIGLSYETITVDGNVITTAGITRIMSLIAGAGGQALDNTHTRLGVGNSTTAEAVGQTDLQAAAGATNRWFQVMDATYPQVSGGTLTAKATFGSADANFVWNEWALTVDSGASVSSATVGALLLNRKVPSPNLGTKTTGIYVLTVQLTLS